MSQKPSVGRVVHLHDSANSDQPIAAFIVYVHDDELVDVMAFAPNGQTLHETSVDFSETPEDGCWSWPPRV